MGRQAWQDIPEVRERIEIVAIAGAGQGVEDHRRPSATATPKDERVPLRAGRGPETSRRGRRASRALAHVGRLGPEADVHSRGPTQHGRPSGTARTWPRVRELQPEGTRTVGSLGSTISIEGERRGQTGSRSTSRAGGGAGVASVGSPSRGRGGIVVGSRSRQSNACRPQWKGPSFSPSPRQRARTVSPLRRCGRIVRRLNVSRIGSRGQAPRQVMPGSPQGRRIGSRQSSHGLQDGVRKANVPGRGGLRDDGAQIDRTRVPIPECCAPRSDRRMALA
jgi:hypothetical protein